MVSYNSVCGYSGFREVTVTKTPFFNLWQFRTIKLLFLFENLPLWNLKSFLVLNWRKRGQFAPEFQVLSRFSVVFINTTASSEVVNHASTVNVFSCKNSQFQLPQNFISQIDRGNIALSLEYHFSNESHVPGRDFRRWKMAKLMVAIMLI